mmetsp:Transcript_1177/g.3250  ORF Transcript_1177/g.3250 Transcript_1177/m.3250 type:complete len:298 (-) Transcript_1177:135-1028(-)
MLVDERSAMEEANALIGQAFFCYITHDTSVCTYVFEQADWLMSRFWSSEWGMMRQGFATPARPTTPVGVEGLQGRRDLLAQLDQLNAYLMILRPLAAAFGHADRWETYMLRTALAIKEHFWNEDEDYQLTAIWGDVNLKALDSVHTDFGHTLKSLWFIMMTGAHYDVHEWVQWGHSRALKLMELAWLPSRIWRNASREEDADIGVWASDRQATGAPNYGFVCAFLLCPILTTSQTRTLWPLPSTRLLRNACTSLLATPAALDVAQACLVDLCRDQPARILSVTHRPLRGGDRARSRL